MVQLNTEMNFESSFSSLCYKNQGVVKILQEKGHSSAAQPRCILGFIDSELQDAHLRISSTPNSSKTPLLIPKSNQHNASVNHRKYNTLHPAPMPRRPFHFPGQFSHSPYPHHSPRSPQTTPSTRPASNETTPKTFSHRLSFRSRQG